LLERVEHTPTTFQIKNKKTIAAVKIILFV
jgi:hypothetical protein